MQRIVARISQSSSNAKERTPLVDANRDHDSQTRPGKGDELSPQRSTIAGTQPAATTPKRSERSWEARAVTVPRGPVRIVLIEDLDLLLIRARGGSQ